MNMKFNLGSLKVVVPATESRPEVNVEINESSIEVSEIKLSDCSLLAKTFGEVITQIGKAQGEQSREDRKLNAQAELAYRELSNKLSLAQAENRKLERELKSYRQTDEVLASVTKSDSPTPFPSAAYMAQGKVRREEEATF